MSSNDESDRRARNIWYGIVGFLIFCAAMGQINGPPRDIEDDTGICMRPSAQLGC